MTVLAVAAISARMLAESASDDGFEVVALDLFGDVDTRRASRAWIRIGEPATMAIDSGLLLAALDALARKGDVSGWIAGPGFEGRCDLLERGAALLPLIGTPADAVRRVRDPAAFFRFLDAQGLPHPAVRMEAPEDPDGWLVKDALGCGGWHIRRATPTFDAPGPHHYFQREVPGTSMSATFIANGSDAAVIGFNQQIVRPLAGRPFVFCGVVGPVPLPGGVARQVTAAVRSIATAFSLRGLGSLDFMRDGDRIDLLEVNPRPSQSMALYRHSRQGSQGMVAAHVRACVQGELGNWPSQAPDDTVQGTEVVYATRPLWLDESAARRLAARADCHDLPNEALQFDTGEPLCSVSASGANAGDVHAMLARRCEAVHQSLEMSE